MDDEPDDSGIATDVVAPHLDAQRPPGAGRRLVGRPHVVDRLASRGRVGQKVSMDGRAFTRIPARRGLSRPRVLPYHGLRRETELGA
jgi:hypothetical protein